MTRIIKNTHILLAALVMSTSCIFDAPGDCFYRTLWESDEYTLDFLCGQSVCIKSASESTTSYGKYESDEYTATFTDLTLTIGNQTLIFTDAHRDDDTLILNWRLENSQKTLSTTMHRLYSYPN